MAVEVAKEEQDEPPINIMWVCPVCRKTAHISRKYCDCGAVLRGAAVAKSTKLPKCGPLNFEVPGLSCNDCPEGYSCRHCSSFAEPQTNSAGFGGEECEHRDETKRCHCCRSQVEARGRMATFNFSAYMSEIRKRNKAANSEAGNNLFAKAASIIYDEMTAPILARIRREEERAV
ncbi:MAG: hypothetical protein LBG27_10095 [Spirochaetaceae bacterium]|jgi:hypothetical protein|nr:hypothetical protein [Spirochaetaceae bacterium]